MSDEKRDGMEKADAVDTLAIKLPAYEARFEDDRSRKVALIVQTDRFRQALRSSQPQGSAALGGRYTPITTK
ncbi:hypothetical protein [Pseudomonas sp. PS02290]|uniref:hypothetical protein n=1 Tax=Pseudomonas sp. PS02290 TaxID=2991430 RepID=UPI00249CCC88|nr:hypothetical protein [Pseudomonas sp. PS02290]